MPKLFSYIAYTLGITSTIEFPGLIAKKTSTDVYINSEKIVRFPQGKVILDNPESISLIKFSNKDVGVLLNNKPFFRVKNGNEIIINSDLNLNPDLTRFLILNQGMGILLYQKGYLVLHGSAVNRYGEAIAFVGPSKIGKSTIATILNINDHPIVADDVLAIKFENDKPLILPSFPILRLRAEAVETLFDKSNSFSHITQSDKYNYNSNKNFSTTPLPLKRVYILKNSDNNKIIPLKFQDGLIELIKQSYTLRFFDNQQKYKNLFQCTNVVKNVPTKYLFKSTKNNKDLLSKIGKDLST